MKTKKALALEIGRVYKSKTGPRYRLCIGDGYLVSAYEGEVVKHRPGELVLMAEVTAEDLCDIWSITLEQLDSYSAEWLYPDLKPNPRHLERGERGRRQSGPMSPFKILRQ
jgi:hypothetical protein